MRHIVRGGVYWRVCDPGWHDCADTAYSKRFGGRWNAPGSFGILHLNADVATAAANARRMYDGEALSLLDLNPTLRPHLQEFIVRNTSFVDAITPAGVAALQLPTSYPRTGTWGTCRTIGQRASDTGESGIACRSCAMRHYSNELGEELALFDRARDLATRRERKAFEAWYPGFGE